MPAVIRIVWTIFLCSLFIGCHSPEREAENAYLEGIRYKERGELRQAFQRFRVAVAHNPRHVNAHIELGELFCRDKKYAEAIKHLLRAVEYGASSYKSYVYMGYAYEQLGNLAFAERYYKEAIPLAPELLAARLRLADILELQGKWREAADILQKVLEIKPDIENDVLLKARISLLRQPQSLAVHRALADVYISHGDIQKGIAEYRKFEPLGLSTPQALVRFGLFCADRGQPEIAVTYLEKALELGGTNQPDVRKLLGMVYEELGRFHNAIEEYRAVLQLQPDAHNVRLKLAGLLEQVKQHYEAAVLLEEIFHKGQAEDINALWGKILRLRGEESEKAIVQLKRSGQFDVVDILINDLVPATLIVDTRAEYTIISEELAQRLNIVLSTRTSEVHFDFYGRTFTAPLINLSSLKVGELEVQNVPTLIWDLSEYSQIEGVLGISFLKHFQVDMNYEDQLFVLRKLQS